MNLKGDVKVLKKKKIIIISVIAAAVLALIAIITVFALSRCGVKFIGNVDNRQIEVLSQYSGSNVKAEVDFLWFKIHPKTETSGEVNTKKTGEYTLVHTAKFFGGTYETISKVMVVDTTPPEIKTEDDNVTIDFVSYPINPNSIKVSFTATDNYDGDITAKVEKTVKDNVCILTVSDSSGNTAQKKINLVFDDGIRPVLVLKGPSTVYLEVGSKYAESGYSATDNLDGNITDKVKVSGKVDTSTSGIYNIEYSVTDSSGNITKLIKKVVVYGNANTENFNNITPNGKTVYLTFDDGPGAYTERLLSVLKKYNVKATFFVTNQFSKYQSLIGKAHSEGHKIAVHTYSHQMYTKDNNIYSSVEAYLKDFNAMQSVIKAQTGSKTNIFRFPGGTNNTISKSSCKGIMTELTKQMTDAGYFYFDWNVDSYDSRSSSNTQKIITETINQIKNKKNAVVLMHDIHKKTVDAVPAIIEYCLENGYTFDVLSENSPAVRYKPQN